MTSEAGDAFSPFGPVENTRVFIAARAASGSAASAGPPAAAIIRASAEPAVSNIVFRMVFLLGLGIAEPLARGR